MRQLLDYLISPEELEALKLRHNGPSNSTPNHKSELFTVANQRVGHNVPLGCGNGFKATIRLSGRVLLIGSVILTTVDRLRLRLQRSSKPRLWDGLGIRIPLSLSVLIFLHRTLHRMVLRLQLKLESYPRKAPSRVLRILKDALLSSGAPSCAAALSGIALASIPSRDARLTISIYVFTKTAEYLSNALHISDRAPWWFGSWTLFPFALAQLFKVLLNGEGGIPLIYQKALMTFPFTGTDQIRVLGHQTSTQMADVARIRFPTFKSAILFPHKEHISEVTKSVFREAHPAIRHMSCAISHPKHVSCSGAWVAYCLRQFQTNAQLFSAIYSMLFLSKLGSFRGSPWEAISHLLNRTIKTSAFTTFAVATSWSTLCLCQRILPTKLLGPHVFYLSGFLGGLTAFIDRRESRLLFLDAARSAILSWWKSKRQPRYLHRLLSPDLLLFMGSIAVLNILYDFRPKAITSKGARNMIRLLRDLPRPSDGSLKDISSLASPDNNEECFQQPAPK